MYNSTNTKNYYPYNNMMYQNSDNIQYISEDDDRFFGGFAFPFLLGGVTGAAIAPAFYRPNYGNYYNYPPYRPYPYYYRRWY